MTNSAEFIVLHVTKFSENSVVVHALSREYGRHSFFVKGVGTKTSMSLFLPLNILEADVRESTKSTLFPAVNVHALHPLNGIRGNIFKNSITLFLAEVLYRVVKEGGKEEGLYDWCVESILLLDALEADFANFHIWFLMDLAVHLGFAPKAEDLMPFAGEHLDKLSRLFSSSFSEAMLIPLTGAVRNEIAESLLRYVEYHCESPLNVNSLAVLRELFS